MQEIYLEDQQLISRFKSGDEDSLIKLYQAHRREFIQWAQQTYKLDEEVAADAFQDAVVCLHHNIVKEKLQEMNNPLKNYLFALAKYVLSRKLSIASPLSGEETELIRNLYADAVEAFAGNDRQKFVAKLMVQIGDPCHTTLRLFYFKGVSLQTIAETMKYKNENAVKTQMLRCLTHLKKMLNDSYSAGEFYEE
ncbi:MAG: RNA polymerase sigma factor [Cyclobacteriaceae bacterium]